MPPAQFDFTLSGNIDDANGGSPGSLDFFSPTSETSNVDRNLRFNAEHHGARSTTSLTLGDSSEDLSFVCNTPVDPTCPNAFPTPAPGASSNPPYAQVFEDQHAMASLRNVTGDDRYRLVYGVDLMRGIARVDSGTGGGSPMPPTTRRSSIRTRRRRRTCRRSGLQRTAARCMRDCAASATAV